MRILVLNNSTSRTQPSSEEAIIDASVAEKLRILGQVDPGQNIYNDNGFSADIKMINMLKIVFFQSFSSGRSYNAAAACTDRKQ